MRPSKYGVEQLAVGQFLSIPKTASWMDVMTFHHRARNSIYEWGARNGRKFRVRLTREPVVVTVERIA